MSSGLAIAAAGAEVPLSTPPEVWTFDRDTRRVRLAPGATALAVTCAGVLFDRESLARVLGLPFVVPDATLIAAGYERWGLDLFAQLRGAFAIAIVDRLNGRTILARDQMGLQPLFYALLPDRLLAGSSPRALSRSPGVSRDLNRLALADALCRRFPDVEETYYQAVRRVPPGSYLLLTASAHTTHRYWRPLEHTAPSANTAAEAFEQYETLQRQAVRRCAAVGAPAVFLSGGLDSVGVAAALADEQAARGARPPVAVSLTFPGADCDESEVQQAVARALRLPHSVVTFGEAVGAEPLVHQATAFNRHLSSPLLNFWRPIHVPLANKGREQGARTVLTGEGGDEWMMPSDYTAADLIARGRVFALRRFLRSWGHGERSNGLLWHRGFRPLTGRLLAGMAPEAWDRRRARRVAEIDPTWIAPDPQLRQAQRSRAHRSLGPARPRRGFAAADLEATLQGAFQQQNQEEWFCQGELLGMRFLHPYEDVDLVSFFCRLPAVLSNAGTMVRGLPRRQLAARFPALGFTRQKKVMATDFHAETMAQGQRVLQTEQVRFPWLSELGIVDEALVCRDVQEPGRLPAARVWQLAGTEAWIRAQVSG